MPMQASTTYVFIFTLVKKYGTDLPTDGSPPPPGCERRCQQLPTRVVCAGKAETGPSGIFENPCFARCEIGPPVRFYPPWRCRKFKGAEAGNRDGQESLLAHLQI